MIKHRVDTLINESEVKNKVKDLGEQISAYYQSLFTQQSTSDTAPQLVLIGLLRGSFIFMADLARAIDVSHEIDFMTVSSYGSGTKTSGEVKILKDLDEDIAGKHVLVVEDIIDSGNTLSKVKRLLALRNPASIKLCALLDKPSRRETYIDIDWCGFSIEDLFVVGYGIDYAQHYRHLPFIGQVIPL